MNKSLLSVLVLFLHLGPLRAQPTIGSLSIDEGKDLLTIAGLFGSTYGVVTVDDIRLNVLEWSDTLIKALIPHTGRGSAGPVVVEAFNAKSKPHNISRYYLSIGCGSFHQMSCGAYDESRSEWDLTFRVPVESILLNGQAITLSVSGNHGSMSGMFEHQAPIYEECAPGDESYRVTDSDDTISFSIGFEEDANGVIHLYSYAPTPDVPSAFGGSGSAPNIVLDSSYGILKGTSSVSYGGAGAGCGWDGRTDFPVRPEVIKSKVLPVLIAPENEADVESSSVYLAWLQQDWATNYELQVSRDSLFSTDVFSIFTTVPSETLNLSQRLGQHFWRVRGLSDGVTGRWSVPGIFKLVVPANVDPVHQGNEQLDWTVYDLLGRIVARYHGVLSDRRVPSGPYLFISTQGRHLVYVR